MEYAYQRSPEKYKYLAFEITNPFTGIKEGEEYTDKSFYDYLGKDKGYDANGDGFIDYFGCQGPHYNDGYDYAGSRNSFGVNYAEYIREFALVYQITRDRKYAEMAYDVLVSLCDKNNWNNWAHKHFLSVGETLSNLSFAYDWLYDVWVEISTERGAQYRLDVLTQTIFDRTIYYGYTISRYAKTSNVFTRDSEGYSNGVGTNVWNWSVTTINWNCVCN
jgi:hypothetical protein